MTKNHHKECEGCNLKVTEFCSLQNHHISEVRKCPCINCIVKMVCVKMCPQRIALYSNLCYTSNVKKNFFKREL